MYICMYVVLQYKRNPTVHICIQDTSVTVSTVNCTFHRLRYVSTCRKFSNKPPPIELLQSHGVKEPLEEGLTLEYLRYLRHCTKCKLELVCTVAIII